MTKYKGVIIGFSSIFILVFLPLILFHKPWIEEFFPECPGLILVPVTVTVALFVIIFLIKRK